MCGIAGILNFESQNTASFDSIKAMTDIMSYRGPDDEGHYVEGPLALGSRRLSIMDLSSRGHMPFESQCGRFVIVHNGEIYNFKDLAREFLSALTLRSDSDTEVIVELYAKMGANLLQHLNGMFAFAIWDKTNHELFLARDRMGVKPLYYSTNSAGIIFGSEEKCLFAGGVDPVWDSSTFLELSCFRYVAGERTPFNQIKRLLPGHSALVSRKGVSIKKWWSLYERALELRHSSSRSFRESCEKFESLFMDSVRYRLISDAPVGIMLSGGLDSGSVAAALSQLGHKSIAAFTVGFRNSSFDETHLAQSVAQKFDLKFFPIQIEASELMQNLDQASYLSDEPLIHGNDPHVLALSKVAKQHVKVLLSGEGSDETLGGYVRYSPLQYPNLLRSLRPLLGVIPGLRWQKLSEIMNQGGLDGLLSYNSCNVFPWDLKKYGWRGESDLSYREKLIRESKQLHPSDRVRQAMYIDHHTFLESVLHRNDRMTMGASVECRVPFLDFRLVEFASALPREFLLTGFRQKKILRETLVKRLPESVQKARKWGFGVPWSEYLSEDGDFKEVLQSFCKSEALRDFLPDFKLDEASEALKLQLFLFGHWYQRALPELARQTRHRRALSA